MSNQKQLNLIIDGNNLAHRVKHTFSLSNHGVDVSITYGVLKNLHSLVRKFDAATVLVCWDGGRPSFRMKSLPEYKAGRGAMDELEYDNFIRQVRELSDYALPLLGIGSVRKISTEADDLMYHASKIIYGKNVIVTTDKDLMQAIDKNTVVYHPFKNIIYKEDNFEELIGIPQEKFLLWRALIGDGSDNIKGVDGIGEVTATKILKEFGTLNDLYAGKGMTEKLAAKINYFGLDNIIKNIRVMSLESDLTGSRRYIIKSIDSMPRPRFDMAKKYMMKNAFVSLLDDFLWDMEKLSQPIILENVRVPLVNIERKPYASIPVFDK